MILISRLTELPQQTSMSLTRGRGYLPRIGHGRELLLRVPAREVQSVLRAAEVLDGELAVLGDGGAARATARERVLARVRPVGGPARRRLRGHRLRD